MTRALLLLGILSGGCLIVPATKTSTKPVGTELGDMTFTRVRELKLTAQIADRNVSVHGVRIGECVRPVFAVSEVTSERELALGGASDPRARAFGFLLSPVTIPLSFIYSGLVVAGDSPETTRKTKSLGTKREGCMADAADMVVSVTLPSGATATGKTGFDGKTVIEIPHGEPYSGTVTVSATGAQENVQLAYSLPKPPVTAARDALAQCGDKHAVTGSVTLKLTINHEGRATHLWASAGDAAFNACLGQAIATVRFPEATRGGTLALPMQLPARAASL